MGIEEEKAQKLKEQLLEIINNSRPEYRVPTEEEKNFVFGNLLNRMKEEREKEDEPRPTPKGN